MYTPKVRLSVGLVFGADLNIGLVFGAALNSSPPLTIVFSPNLCATLSTNSAVVEPSSYETSWGRAYQESSRTTLSRVCMARAQTA